MARNALDKSSRPYLSEMIAGEFVRIFCETRCAAAGIAHSSGWMQQSNKGKNKQKVHLVYIYTSPAVVDNNFAFYVFHQAVGFVLGQGTLSRPGREVRKRSRFVPPINLTFTEIFKYLN